MASLVLVRSPQNGTPPQKFPVDLNGRPRLLIGMHPTTTPDRVAADIVVDDGTKTISRHHAAITVDRGRYFIQNLGRNGTYVNGRRFGDASSPQRIRDGDRLRICDFHFQFEDPPIQPLLPPWMVDLPEPEVLEDESTTMHVTVYPSDPQGVIDTAPAQRLRALLEIAAKLSRALEMDALLPEITNVLFALFEQADRAFVFLMDDSGRPYVKIFRSRLPNSAHGFSNTVVHRCLREMKGVLIEDTRQDDQFDDAPSIGEGTFRTCLCVPLSNPSGHKLGALQLDSRDVTKQFREEDLKLLTVIADLAAMALEKAQMHIDLVKHKEHLKEIEHAKKIQLQFLPEKVPVVPGYDFYKFYHAAKTVGGDYFDFIALPDGRLAILLGDVAGKGVPASLMMAKLSAEARSCILAQSEPAEALARLNNDLIRGGIGGGYVTMTAMVLDPASHTIAVANAGHMTPLRYRNLHGEFGDCMDNEGGGFPLGIVAGTQYQTRTVSLEAGDTLMIFTDGVTDAEDPDGIMFGLDRLLDLMREIPSATYNSTTMGERVVGAVRKHANGADQNDDIALVCFGRIA